MSRLKRLFQFAVPAHFNNPVGLAWRLLRSRNPIAWFAMKSAAAAMFCAPFDRLASLAERRLVRNSTSCREPLLFITGPPRSGTTLAAQLLISATRPTYINNLTSLFPNAPILANRLLGRFLEKPRLSTRNYYGRTLQLAGPNDGLHLWDRWLGKDRTTVRTELTSFEQEELRRFFAAYERAFGGPILNKNNNLLPCLPAIAEILPTSRFICLTRQPLFLAQSLLVARRHIHGGDDFSYGLHERSGALPDGMGVLEDVCRQVLFYQRLIRQARQSLGADRLRLIEYEDLCKDPGGFVRSVARDFLDTNPRHDAARQEPLRASRTTALPAQEFEALRQTWDRLQSENKEVAVR